MDHIISTLRDLFLAIWLEQNNAWGNDRAPNKPSSKAKEVLNRVRTLGSFANQLTREALLNKLPSSQKHADDFGQAYLLLPPSEKESRFVSLMWLGYDLSTVPQDVRIYVTMFCLKGNKLKRLAFRLESHKKHDGNDADTGTGRHEFCHAQLGNRRVKKKPSWLPESQPSFPLCAKCPVTLLISLLLTLYGRKETARLLRDHKTHRIEHYRDQLEPWVIV